METAFVTTLAGLGLLLAGIIKSREKSRLKNYGIKVKGIVYSLELNRKSQVYYPVVRFRTKQQEWITKKMDFGTNPPQYAEGSRVDLIYDPDEPENVDIDASLQLTIVPKTLLIAGVACWVYVILLLSDLI